MSASHWGVLALGIAIGLLIVPTSLAVVGFVSRGFSKNIGTDGCYVCAHSPKFKIGERTHWYFWATNAWHRWVWATRSGHARAWAAHRWNRAWNPENGAFKIECSDEECNRHRTLDRGPYSDADAATFPARDHERVYHGGERTVKTIDVSERYKPRRP